jgi:hypothetical protein
VKLVLKGRKYVINNADIIDRLRLVIGQELNRQQLHEALFCEEKHKKILRRFNSGKYNYIEYKVKKQEHPNISYVADITLLGNPNTFRIGIQDLDGRYIIHSEPRISYSYL